MDKTPCHPFRLFASVVAFFYLFLLPPCPVNAGGNTKKKVIAGKADVLRKLPKKFAAFQGYDSGKSTVTLLIEGEEKPSTWKIDPRAEIKVLGWWGRLSQISKGDRVWAWFGVDRGKKPRSVLMLADEISEQDIHGWSYSIMKVENLGVTAKSGRGKVVQLRLPPKEKFPALKAGNNVYLQTADKQIRVALTEKELERARNKQKDYLRTKWLKEGLPGMVSFLHPLGGEMEIMLDHEGHRWGRYLKVGDKVTLESTRDDLAPIQSRVRRVEPWREFTRVLLVTHSGIDQTELTSGQRIRALVPEPPKELQESKLPLDIGRRKGKEERLQWFLASTYCTCKVKGDRCTGMVYTLASCNVNACGMPNKMRGIIGKMIDEGKTDEQIFAELLKMRGPTLLKQHLLP